MDFTLIAVLLGSLHVVWFLVIGFLVDLGACLDCWLCF